jgi:anti-sigma B factor antagonist
MEASVEQRDGVVTVHIAGSVDGTTADSLQQVFARELEAGHHQLIADFSAVDYTSSAGLRVLLGTVKRARSGGGGGDLRLAGPNPDVRKVLDLSGFTSILKVFETVDDAVQSFGRPG